MHCCITAAAAAAAAAPRACTAPGRHAVRRHTPPPPPPPPPLLVCWRSTGSRALTSARSVCVYVCTNTHTHIYIYIHTYKNSIWLFPSLNPYNVFLEGGGGGQDQDRKVLGSHPKVNAQTPTWSLMKDKLKGWIKESAKLINDALSPYRVHCVARRSRKIVHSSWKLRITSTR